MNLSYGQRQRLRKGDYSPLAFPFDPDPQNNHGKPVEGACCVVLEVEGSRRVADQVGNVTVVPPRPVHWIEVTDVRRHRKGHWQVRFDAKDLREHPRYLAAGGGYTSSRFRAIDELETVPSKDQERMSKEASDRDHLVRLEQVAARRTERWRVNRERRKAIEGFRPAA